MKLSHLLFAALALTALVGCGDDVSSTADARTTSIDADTSFVCDPIGSNAEMGGLLNAPLAPGVEVINKQGAHPGDPGPLALP